MGAPFFYFDHAAATPLDTEVYTAMLPYLQDQFFNPSSPYQPAVAVRREYEQAKAELAATFGAKGDELIMTAGATESINLAFSSSNGHVVTSNIEHDAVLAAARLKKHTIVEVSDQGMAVPEAIEAAITAETDLVSIQLANNEIGTIQPIRQIAEVIKHVNETRQAEGNHTPLLFHCDASQGFGQIDVNAARLGVDMLTLNAAKMYGPKQTALLWVKPGVSVSPIVVGGGQERGLRSGTENVAAVIGFSEAAKRAHKKRHSEAKRLSLLRDEMQRRLLGAFPAAHILGSQKKRLPGSLHISFPNIDAERLIFKLELENVLVATGSACAANKGTRSHVLTAIHLADELADGSLRLTLGKLNDEESCKVGTERIITAVREEYDRMAQRA